MRLLDRILAVVVGLILIGFFTVVAIAPDTIRTAMAAIEDVNLIVRVAVVVVLNILVLVTLYMNLRTPRKTITGLAVRAPGAQTDVSVESARKLILNAVESVPAVASANATVKAVNGKADVDLDVQVTGNNVHIPQKQKEISRALRQVIHKQLGLQMRGQPRVHIYLKDETPQERPAVAVPAVTAVEKVETPVVPPPPARAALPTVEKTASAEPEPEPDDEETLIKRDVPEADRKSTLADTENAPADDEPAPEESADAQWLESYLNNQANEDDKKQGDE